MADKSFIRMESTCLEDELDFLNAVFFEELQISDMNTPENEKILFLNLEPSTADDKTKQFVFVNLKVCIPPKYPLVSPQWTTVNSRGLSDELLAGLLAEAKRVSETKTGHSMLYEVIEHLKVYITEQNKPSESCCVCMSDFEEVSEMDPVMSCTKTDCFHYFHLACFAGYIQSEMDKFQLLLSEENIAGLEKKVLKLECPVCREVIASESKCLQDIRDINPDNFFHQQSGAEAYKPDEKMLEEQARRADMFERQRLAGGIIDLDQEAAKFDVDTDWRPPTPPESKFQSETCQETTEVIMKGDTIIKNTAKTTEEEEGILVLPAPSELEMESEKNDCFTDKTKYSPIHQPRKPYENRTNQSDYRKYHEPYKNQQGTRSSPRREVRYYNSGRRDYSRKDHDHPRRDQEYSRRDHEYPRNEYDYSRKDREYSRNEYDYSRKDHDYSGKDREYPRNEYNHSRKDHDDSRKDHEHSRKDNDYSIKDREYSKRDHDDSRKDHDYSRKDNDYSIKDREYPKRDHDDSRKDHDYSRKDNDYSIKDREYSKRDHDDSRKDHDYSRKDNDYSIKDREYPKNDYEHSRNDQDCSRKDHDYSRKDHDYSRKDHDYSRKDNDYSIKDREYSKRDHEYPKNDSEPSRNGHDYSRRDNDYKSRGSAYSGSNYNDSYTKHVSPTYSSNDYEYSDRDLSRTRPNRRNPRERGRSTANREWTSDQ